MTHLELPEWNAGDGVWTQAGTIPASASPTTRSAFIHSFIRSFILTDCRFCEHAKHLHHRFAGIGHAGSRG